MSSRRRRWIVVLAMVGVVGLSAWWWLPSLQRLVGGYLSLGWSDRDQRASVWSMIFGALSLVSSILLGVAQMLQARRLNSRIREADRHLRARLGRRQRLPRTGSMSPRRARVHPAISVPQESSRSTWQTPLRPGEPVPEVDLPLFVERDLWPEVLRWTKRARGKGGFLLLVGTSSVGKTRLLFEAARRELGDFRALVPDLGNGEVVNALAADGPREPLVVWLDELQRFLPGPYFAADQAPGFAPLTATAIRQLLDNYTPVVVLGTLWPEHVHRLRATEEDPGTSTTRPSHPQAVDILDLVTHTFTVSSFSQTERNAAARLADQDPRLAVAVANLDYNVTETLAGVPSIMRRYTEALPEAQAILHAAVDARRMGIQGPLFTDLLRAAARGDLIGVHGNDTWFDHALHTMTRSDRRDDAATAPLKILGDTEHRTVLGYTVTDYLLQHLVRQRRNTLLTDTAWRALEQHTRTPDDLERLADSAYQRMQYALTVRISSALLAAGETAGAVRLARLLIGQGKREQAETVLRRAAAAGDEWATDPLAEMLVEQGRLDELRAMSDAGDPTATFRLTMLLRGQGKLDESEMMLKSSADAGNQTAAIHLAQSLVMRNMLHELRALAAAGNTVAAVHLAAVLFDNRQSAEAEALLRPAAEAGDPAAARGLAELLVSRGEFDEAAAVLRPWVENGNHMASILTARLLFLKDDASAAESVLLRSTVHDHNPEAAAQLCHLLVQQDRIDELRALAETGNREAADTLAAVVVDHGSVDELHGLARTGNRKAALYLADILVEEGKVDEAEAVLRAAVDVDAHLADLLIAQDKYDELRALSDAGSTEAARRLTRLLAEQNKLDELWQEVHAGTEDAAAHLIHMLSKQHSAEADRLRQWGLTADGKIAKPW